MTDAKKLLTGDVRIDPKYPPGTPPEQIFEFEIWDGSKWLPSATARDMLYHVGSGASDTLRSLFGDEGIE
jgi:hypothetical protein